MVVILREKAKVINFKIMAVFPELL
jgi:hypothetical protein